MKQMDGVRYYDGNLYIKINEKNKHLVKDKKNIYNLLIWNIKNKKFSAEKLMIQNNLNINSQKDYNYFYNDILSSLKYKVYFKIFNINKKVGCCA